jgi:hypothetical protein
MYNNKEDVNDLFEIGKINNIINDQDNIQVKCNGSGKCTIDDHVVYYSSESSIYHYNRVRMILSKEIDKYMLNLTYKG